MISNNDYNVSQTNVQFVTNKLISTVECQNTLDYQIRALKDNYAGFKSNLTDLKEMINQSDDIYDEGLFASFDERLTMLSQIEERRNRINDLKGRIATINSRLGVLRKNLSAIQTAKEKGTAEYNGDNSGSWSPDPIPNPPQDPTHTYASDYTKTYAIVINHYDGSINMAYAAQKMVNLLVHGDGVVPYAKPENILWIDYNNGNTIEDIPGCSRFRLADKSNEWMKKKGGDGKLVGLVDKIQEQISKVPEDGLLIFFYGGHGGGSNNYGAVKAVKKEYLSIQYSSGSNSKFSIYDNEVNKLFKQCKGRVFQIFDCCHAGTMFNQESKDDIAATNPVEQSDEGYYIFSGDTSDKLNISKYTDVFSSISDWENGNGNPIYVGVPQQSDDNPDDVYHINKTVAFSASSNAGSEYALTTSHSNKAHTNEFVLSYVGNEDMVKGYDFRGGAMMSAIDLYWMKNINDGSILGKTYRDLFNWICSLHAVLVKISSGCKIESTSYGSICSFSINEDTSLGGHMAYLDYPMFR